VPRILVADDNSNIQRTVSLALKDAGVEVVAVGNGEAAVRKIAEIKPDLVLADIFMPVRSGYEVCEFVKHDPRFANTPVVLLIGAFDPFDEREAQRVQADGILKKPFVPPDSLVRMVGDLLAQSATRMAPVPVGAGAAKMERASAAGTVAREPEPQAAEFADEAPEELEPPKARLEWKPSEQPVAFSTLLENPFTGTEEAVVTAQRDPNLGEPAFWTEKSNPKESDEQADEESEAGANEASARELIEDEEQWGRGVEFVGDGSTESADAGAIETQQTEPEPPRATMGSPEPAASLNQTTADFLEPAGELLPELPPLPVPPSPEKSPAALPPRSQQSWGRESLGEIPALELPAAPESEDELPELKDFAWAAPSYTPVKAEEEAAPKSPAGTPIDAALAEIANLAELSSSSTSEKEPASEFEPIAPFRADAQSGTDIAGGAAGPGSTPVVNAAAFDVETIVTRVIERMQPKMIDLVTRELLRPVVEALVRRELEKK
jgi:CheY-like chemotaxis protein